MEDAVTFHWAYGWYFSRLPDGSVEAWNHGDFEKPDPNHVSGDGRTTLVIPATEWASIVCWVSKEGETSARWEQAQDFHGREPVAVKMASANQSYHTQTI